MYSYSFSLAMVVALLVCDVLAQSSSAPEKAVPAIQNSVTKPFLIRIVDEQTQRGVPLVELVTVNNLRFITDSAGLVAFNEPGFMGTRVYFSITSHGYEFPKDGFGYRGKALDVKPGGEVTIPIQRLNIAQRLYRITGQGIYRDTILAGLKAPTEQPVMNGLVLGQDTVQCVIYKNRIHWFWGDTNRAAYPLGQFGTAGAVSDLPSNGGLDPDVGVNLRYFVDPAGFSRPMVPGTNLRWVDGFLVVRDEAGQDRMIGRCDVLKSLSERIERKLIIYNDAKDAFDDLVKFDRDEPLCAQGHVIRHTVDGKDYFYFYCPLAVLRVEARLEAIKTTAAYEGFTCLAPGARYAKGGARLDRDSSGKLIWAWKKNTPPLTQEQHAELVKTSQIKPDEKWYDLKDVQTKATVNIQNGSIAWNPFKKKWILIVSQLGGKSSMLGEIWYSESDKPEGPWRWARKIITHDKYSFYNPVHHPFFDKDGGRTIYLEGTYTYTFSRQGDPTPLYDYNQVMYKLDLGDERLKLPE